MRLTTGDLIAVIAVSAKMGRGVIPSQVLVSALMGTRDGVVRSPASTVTMGRHANYPASVSMVPPVTTRQESASVRRVTRVLCEYQHHVFLFGVNEKCLLFVPASFVDVKNCRRTHGMCLRH